MKNSKMAKLELELDNKAIVLCVLIPFVLFWGGMLTPFFTDNLWVYIFALAPFYVYVEMTENFSYKRLGLMSDCTFALNFISSVVIVISKFFFDLNGTFFTMAAVNSFVSIFYFAGHVCARERSEWMSFPVLF